jgi:low affinity Fe/Cu permease
MVFVLQNAQTRDTRAIQAKLDEIILTSSAENRFIGIENLDEEDLKHLDRLVAKAAKGQIRQAEEGLGALQDESVKKSSGGKRGASAKSSRQK